MRHTATRHMRHTVTRYMCRAGTNLNAKSIKLKLILLVAFIDDKYITNNIFQQDV